MTKGLAMPQQENLPISEPALLGVSQSVTVGDPTGTVELPMDPANMQRRLWVMYPLVSLSISMISGAVNGVLLGKIIASFTGVTKGDQAALLGLTISISGIAYLAAGPLGGILSDKTRTRFLGRRNLWILVGAIGAAASVLSLGTSKNVTVLIILASLVTLFVGLILAASSTVLPERVPIRSRGRLSSVNGLMAVIGAGLGTVIGALTPNLFEAFVILAVQVLLFCGLFAFFTRDAPAPARVSKTDLTAIRPKFPTPRSHPDYWLTFLARCLAFVAYGLATGLQLYALRDWFKVGNGSLHAASLVLGAITPFSTLALAVAAVVGGILVDRFGRLKPFVMASSLLFIPAALFLALAPSETGAFVGLIITGFAFGSYISVDGVLMTRVIPSRTNAGRDLGILNVSGGVGSIIAPALAGALVATTGYGLVFLLVIVAGALASLAVLFIRSVR
jgi:MFS family permease